MTIREHFQRVFKRIKNGAVAVTVVLCVAVTVLFPQRTRLQVVGTTVLLGVVIVGALCRVVRRRYLCPRCGANLARLRTLELRRMPFAQRMRTNRQFWQEWNACPHCGVGFEEEWGPGAP